MGGEANAYYLSSTTHSQNEGKGQAMTPTPKGETNSELCAVCGNSLNGKRVGTSGGRLIHYDCAVSKEGPVTEEELPTSNLTLDEVDDGRDVPLEAQTQESLIAYIHSLEKYKKELEVILTAARNVKSKYGNGQADHKAEIESVRALSLEINRMDDLHLKGRQ